MGRGAWALPGVLVPEAFLSPVAPGLGVAAQQAPLALMELEVAAQWEPLALMELGLFEPVRSVSAMG
ncbi:MAG: hypothetical protein IIB42_07560 [Candidatus Marinimicrobia bacterium]|nr:hypothetical protein [Candidatus Neomarinimicrobiota bacterium]MCH7860001.1 hypothetical protein [Candidatus Neomarinimicrobiota bacterium]